MRLPFVSSAPDVFDNSYYVALLQWDRRELERGAAAFLPTDVALVLDARFKRHVQAFARDERLFRTTFARSYAKLVAF